MNNILNLKGKVEQIRYFYQKIKDFEKEIDQIVREKAMEYAKEENPDFNGEEIKGWDLIWDEDDNPSIICYWDEDSWNNPYSLDIQIETLWS
jgi:hypothetical protein